MNLVVSQRQDVEVLMPQQRHPLLPPLVLHEVVQGLVQVESAEVVMALVQTDPVLTSYLPSSPSWQASGFEEQQDLLVLQEHVDLWLVQRLLQLHMEMLAAAQL
jgi:hypothetical protein